MADTNEEQYARYITGLLAFYSWGVPLHEKGMIKVNKHCVDLSGQVSKRFLLGLTRDSDYPFLGAQEPELSWLGKIPWHIALMAQRSTTLTLLARQTAGIPGFAVALPTETTKKLEALHNFSSLDIRFIEIDRSGQLSDLSKTLFSIPTRVMPSDSAINQLVQTEIENRRPGIAGYRR